MTHASCLCGAVEFTIDADLENPITCHCKQCRRQSGHHFAAAPAPFAALTFDTDHGLAWYQHSDRARRGFCRLCGSSLFWHGTGSETVMVAMGALDQTCGLTLSGHYWVDCKGDYYRIADGLPQYKGEGTC